MYYSPSGVGMVRFCAPVLTHWNMPLVFVAMKWMNLDGPSREPGDGHVGWACWYGHGSKPYSLQTQECVCMTRNVTNDMPCPRGEFDFSYYMHGSPVWPDLFSVAPTKWSLGAVSPISKWYRFQFWMSTIHIFVICSRSLKGINPTARIFWSDGVHKWGLIHQSNK